MTRLVERVEDPRTDPTWDRDVAALGAEQQYLAAWFGVVAETFRVTPIYLRGRRPDGRTTGLFAGYVSRSLVAGRHVSSLDGGIVADAWADAAQLWDAGLDEARAKRARYLLLRGGQQPRDADAGVKRVVRPCLNLDPRLEAIWSGVGKKMRNQLRRARELPLTVRVDPAVPADFYPVFARVQRDLGTPVVSARLFQAMNRHLADRLHVVQVRDRADLAGAMVCVAYAGTLHSLYAATRPEDQRGYANYRLYWAALEHAAAIGCTRFDMGRSQPGTGAHAFKAKWRPETREISYLYAPVLGRPPAAAPGPGLANRIWRRLPLRIATTLGPRIRDTLPFG